MNDYADMSIEEYYQTCIDHIQEHFEHMRELPANDTIGAMQAWQNVIFNSNDYVIVDKSTHFAIDKELYNRLKSSIPEEFI